MSLILNPYRFGAPAFAPSDLASCKVWCHPTSGFFSDQDGTTPQSTNGGNVRWWQSVVGGTNVVGLQRRSTSPFEGTPPTLDTSTTLGGLPGVRYTAASVMKTTINYNANLDSALELFLVMKVVADPAATVASSGLYYFAASDLETHYPFTDGNVYNDFATTARKSCGNPSVALTSAHIHNCRSATNDWALLINNASVFSTGTNTTSFVDGFPWIGASKNDDVWLDGWLWEVILFNAVLSSGDRSDVYSYLSAKYGI